MRINQTMPVANNLEIIQIAVSRNFLPCDVFRAKLHKKKKISLACVNFSQVLITMQPPPCVTASGENLLSMRVALQVIAPMKETSSQNHDRRTYRRSHKFIKILKLIIAGAGYVRLFFLWPNPIQK